KVPQDTTLSGDPGALAEATVRSTTLTLHSGVMASGGAANGLKTCTTQQIGFNGGELPGVEKSALENGLLNNNHFNTDAVTCPKESKIGTVSIVTPLLANELKGDVYLGNINTAPF